MTDKVVVYKWTCPPKKYPTYSQTKYSQISKDINWKYLFNA